MYPTNFTASGQLTYNLDLQGMHLPQCLLIITVSSFT